MTPQYQERPVQFGSSQSLFGMLCRPTAEDTPPGPVVVMPNSGLIHRVGANRIHVLLARAMAREGLSSLRFDLSGIGESDRRTNVTSLAESVNTDLADALQFLAGQHQADSFILLGLCSGAYDSLHFAQQDGRVVGIVAIDVPGSFRNFRHLLVHYRRRILTLASWRSAVSQPGRALKSLGWRILYRSESSSEIEEGLRPIMSRDELDNLLGDMNDRDVKSLFLFTTGIEEYYNYEHQFRDCFPERSAHPNLSYGFFRGSDHTFTRGENRKLLICTVASWIRESGFDRDVTAKRD